MSELRKRVEHLKRRKDMTLDSVIDKELKEKFEIGNILGNEKVPPKTRQEATNEVMHTVRYKDAELF